MVQLEIYIKEPINFLRTVTLKNQHFAEHILKKDVHGEFQDILPEELNPYYRHLHGDYILENGYTDVNGTTYPNKRIYLCFDEMMYTQSLDTQEVIPFTKEMLYKHPKTAAQYRIPNDYYSKLCDKYPAQVDLIKAIVYDIFTPFTDIYRVEQDGSKTLLVTAAEQRSGNIGYPMVKNGTNIFVPISNSYDLDKTIYRKSLNPDKVPHQVVVSESDLAQRLVDVHGRPLSSLRRKTYEDPIKSQNLTMLGYDENMFQINEQRSIYTALNNLLEMVRERWWVDEFTYEDMYSITHQAILWHLMYLTIYSQRILNIKTSRVNNFHIWNYLNSKGLDDYRDILSIDQALFLYRNINYLLKNKGTQSNFSILIGALLRPLRVTMYSKSVVQNCTVSTITSEGVSNTDPQKHITLDDQLPATFANTARPTAQVLSVQTGDDNLVDQALYLVSNFRYPQYGKPIDVVQNILNGYTPTIGDTKTEELSDGFIETTQLLYDKERATEIEYLDNNLFKKSTDTQDYRFAVTPHTFLTTKAHEINRDIDSTLYPQVYCKFVEESILYRASENDLAFHIYVEAPNTKISLSLTGNQAVALLMYCACREAGITLVNPPTRAYIEWPYQKVFEDIPETFKYRWQDEQSSKYLTSYGFSDMIAYPQQFISSEDMSEKINQQANNFVRNYIEIHRSSSAMRMELLTKVYQKRCKTGWINLDLTEGASYNRMFYDVEGLMDVITQYNNSVDSELAFSYFFDAILKMLYPVDTTLLLESDNALHDKYSRIKELFVSMCSYNITFMDDIAGMSHYCTTICHNVFDVFKNTNVVGHQLMWVDFHDSYKNILTWLIDSEVIYTGDELYDTPDGYKYQVSASSTALFTMKAKGPYEYTYRTTMDVPDFTSIGVVYRLDEYFHYHMGDEKLTTKSDKDLDVNVVGMTIDMSLDDVMSSTTPIYKDGVLEEVIVEQSNNDDNYPSFTITEENGQEQFNHITYKYTGE